MRPRPLVADRVTSRLAEITNVMLFLRPQCQPACLAILHGHNSRCAYLVFKQLARPHTVQGLEKWQACHYPIRCQTAALISERADQTPETAHGSALVFQSQLSGPLWR